MRRKATTVPISLSIQAESKSRSNNRLRLPVLFSLILLGTYSANYAHRFASFTSFRRHGLESSKLPDYNIVLVAMFHDESRYLLEWIAHHKLLGISHFYLYDHLSTDDFNTTLKPLVESGLVTLTSTLNSIAQLKGVDLPTAKRAEGHKLITQLLTLYHFHVHYAAHTKWSLTIDIDEFLVVEEGDTLVERLDKLVERDSQVGGVYIERLPFTTDGKKDRITRQQLAMGTYFERIKDSKLKSDRGKIVYRSAMRNESIRHLHTFHGCEGKVVDVKGEEYEGGVHKPIAIVHHLTRSVKECEEKRKLSQRYSGGWRHRMHQEYCMRMHRGSEQFRKGMVSRDEYVEQWVLTRKRRICEEMWRMNGGYCVKWKCCGMEKPLTSGSPTTMRSHT